MKKRFLGLSLVTLTLILLGWYLLRDIEVSEFRVVSPMTGLYLVLLTVLNICTHVLAVSILLRGMGYRTGIRSVYLVVTAGGTATYVSNMKLGIPARILLYSKVLGIPASTGTASLALETGIWVAAMGAIMLLPTEDVLLPSGGRLALLALAGLGVVFALFFLNLPKLNRLNEKEGWLADKAKVVLRFVAGFHKAILGVKKSLLVPVAVLLAVQYLIDGSSIHLILRDFGYGVSIFSLSQIIVVSYLVGIVSMMPLGLGTRDLSLAFMLMQLGIPREIAVSSALIQRTVRLALPLILGLLSANILGIKLWSRKDGEDALRAGSGPSSVRD